MVRDFELNLAFSVEIIGPHEISDLLDPERRIITAVLYSNSVQVATYDITDEVYDYNSYLSIDDLMQSACVRAERRIRKDLGLMFQHLWNSLQ